MKTIILAGGYGTRLSEETTVVPKPMVLIGGKPVLWHIMKIFEYHGFNDFIVCLGYKGEVIRDYFLNYNNRNSDLEVDTSTGAVKVSNYAGERWKVHLVDTGLDTMTGGRLRRVSPLLEEGTFMMTYGDCLSDINIRNLVAFHNNHQRLATVSVVQPEGRWGSVVVMPDGRVSDFVEKPKGDGGWINGGFFVLDKKVTGLIQDDQTLWERGPMQQLTTSGNLVAYKHLGFWKGMDTLSDKKSLEQLWHSHSAPWKVWKQ